MCGIRRATLEGRNYICDMAVYFLKALLPMAKRRSPTPRMARVTGQGKGKPKSGLGMRANISITSIINSALPIIKSHFDAVNMIHLLRQLYKSA